MLILIVWIATGSLAQNRAVSHDGVLAHLEDATKSRDGKKWEPTDSWSIRRGETGNFRVEMKPWEKPGASKAMQYGELTSELKPVGYSLDLHSLATDNPLIILLDCHLGTESVHCDCDNNGHASAADLRITTPYVFGPGDFYYGVSAVWLYYSMLFPLRESYLAAPVEIKSVIFTLEDNRGDRNAIGLVLEMVRQSQLRETGDRSRVEPRL